LFHNLQSKVESGKESYCLTDSTKSRRMDEMKCAYGTMNIETRGRFEIICARERL